MLIAGEPDVGKHHLAQCGPSQSSPDSHLPGQAVSQHTLTRSRRSRVRQPGAIKGRLSCGVCSGSRTEQWKSGEDLLQVHHLTRYELGDGDGDDLGRAVALPQW